MEINSLNAPVNSSSVRPGDLGCGVVRSRNGASPGLTQLSALECALRKCIHCLSLRAVQPSTRSRRTFKSLPARGKKGVSNTKCSFGHYAGICSDRRGCMRAPCVAKIFLLRCSKVQRLADGC